MRNMPDSGLSVLDARDPKLDLRAPSTRKKTRHWCRGKRGVPHKLVVRDYLSVKHTHWWPDEYMKGAKILLCSACGKEFDTYIPWPTQREREQVVPDWVTNPPAES